MMRVTRYILNNFKNCWPSLWENHQSNQIHLQKFWHKPLNLLCVLLKNFITTAPNSLFAINSVYQPMLSMLIFVEIIIALINEILPMYCNCKQNITQNRNLQSHTNTLIPNNHIIMELLPTNKPKIIIWSRNLCIHFAKQVIYLCHFTIWPYSKYNHYTSLDMHSMRRYNNKKAHTPYICVIQHNHKYIHQQQS